MKALNLKRMDTQPYRTYRVLRAPTTLGDFYRYRVKTYGNIRGAVIFPEALLGITHQIFSVGVEAATHDTAHIVVHAVKPGLYHKGELVESLEQILDIEASWDPTAKPDNIFTLAKTVRYGDKVNFFDCVMFTNRESVGKYITNRLPSVLNDLKG